MPEQEKLHKVLWQIANDLRGSMDPVRFKDYILGLIFFKFLSLEIESYVQDYGDESLEDLYNSEHREVFIEICVDNLGYFVKPEDSWKSLVAKILEDEYIIDDLTSALRALENSASEKSQDDFSGLFSEINLSSNDLGRSPSERNELIGKIMLRLDELDFNSKDNQNDMLGDAYEYLIGMFAGSAGQKAGEFYTPQCASKLLTKIVAASNRPLESIYDPTCGSGSLLLRAVRELTDDERSTISVYGEELNTTTYNLARMNMTIHGLKHNQFEIHNTNTLEDPQLVNKQFDAIVANPPFSAKWSADPARSEDPRFRDFTKLAPKGKADFAFVQHNLHQLSDTGTCAMILPHGPLFRGNAEHAIRKELLDGNKIDAVIGLPANIFYGTSIPTIVLVLKKCKTDTDVLFIDGSQLFEKGKNQNIMKNNHIDKIMKAYNSREEIEKFAHIATLKEIKENDYNLNIPRYVDTFEEEEPVDIKAVAKRHAELTEESNRIKTDILAQLNDLNGDSEIIDAFKSILEVK